MSGQEVRSEPSDVSPSRRDPGPVGDPALGDPALDGPELHDPELHRRIELPPVRSAAARLLAGRPLMHYVRLAVGVVAVNVAILAVWTAGFASPIGEIDASALADLMLANFALGFIVREQHVVNLLFRIATSVPSTWPLRVRRIAGKIYHFGGLHVGGFFSGSTILAVLVVRWWAEGGATAPSVIGSALLAILVVMMATALPRFRARRHDVFELVARFGTWSSLALFWALALVLETPSDLVAAATTPQLVILAIITVCVALPWTRLRRVPIRISRPSSHAALVTFDHGVTPFAGSSTDVSRSPLREWHSFANVPWPDREGFRLTISRAGDWTGSFVDDRPSHVWVRGIPTAGVGNIETLFSKVVWVATGSGIGPCLPHLLRQQVPARLVWSTRTPRATYGDELVDEILAVQPDALIWDTTVDGKPDMVRLAYQAYVDSGAEAVICISNKSLTWQVVTGLESRGIPAYGAIWDS